ncbi:MAG: ABC transporter ATP-binding protein [Nocardioides sp.]
MISTLERVLGPRHSRELRALVIAIIGYAVLQGAAFALLVPVLRALFEGNIAAASWWLGLLAATVLATVIAYYHQAMRGYRIGMELSRTVHHRIGDHLAALPLGWFTGESVGRIGRLASQGVVALMGVPAHLLQPLVSAIVTPLTVVAMMTVIDWRLALGLVVTTPLLALVYRWTGSLVQRTDHAVDAAAAEAASRVVEFAQVQPVLRAHGRSAEGAETLDRALARQAAAQRRQLFTAVPGLASFVLIVQVAVTIVLVVGVWLLLSADTDPATLIAAFVLVVRFAEPLVAAADLGGAIRIATNTLSRIDELLMTPGLPEPPVVVPGHPADGTVLLRNVHFSYDDDTTVLDGIDLVVPARTATAIVGSSGSGKTTLTKLIARFHDADTGSVSVGGTDVRDQTTEQLMAQLSLVFQDPYLFDGSIRENVAMGRGSASPSEVAAAIAAARVDEIAERLPLGLETRVGEGGTMLSGGERQRISLARALLKDAPVMLLDEATAALDPANEVAVGEALGRLSGKHTLIIVAHRLQTVRRADQIVFLDAGRIVERGTHDELLALGGRYAAFCRERERAAGWRVAERVVNR